MTPAVVESIDRLRTLVGQARASGRTIGLVPTMGALHEGHARLIDVARRECGFVTVSIFVNPLQFDRPDDLVNYPRSLEADTAICARLGADAVFAPAVEEMYPRPAVCYVELRRIADHLCGAFRPGHFSGVATVVLKLLEIARPDRAYFGEKDAQQLAVIRRLVEDVNLPVTIVGVPTVREADGLAMSSRNQRLSAGERTRAIALYRALREAERQISEGATDANAVTRAARAIVPNDAALRLEYLEIVEPAEMQPVTTIARPVVVAGAMWVGQTRLIDNIRVE
jgi:pantoate--beta-alanine ligase